MSEQAIFPSPQTMASGSLGLLNRIYFRVKPLIPARLRWAMRRTRAKGIIRQTSHVWPIDESASQPPGDWSGWPEDKRFAILFTHDVESKAGVENVPNLCELMGSFGLCSSYNFIPEGPYEDPAGLREWLAGKGAEIGVHDLNHDGQLYVSKESFLGKAKRINRYLEKWGAVGFRSGYMLRELDWLHELNILYDASTFDTDPFEPQPEGSQTIFPFVVTSDDDPRKGYVELPYTIPQDSTVFLLLKEQTPEIWIKKLDWIAKHGGLALINIHPDYIRFSNGNSAGDRYSASLLEDFLEHLVTHYQGQFWNPLPRDLAAWYRAKLDAAALPGPSFPPSSPPTPHDSTPS